MKLDKEVRNYFCVSNKFHTLIISNVNIFELASYLIKFLQKKQLKRAHDMRLVLKFNGCKFV